MSNIDSEKYAKIEAEIKEEISEIKKRLDAIEQEFVKSSNNYNKHLIDLHINANRNV